MHASRFQTALATLAFAMVCFSTAPAPVAAQPPTPPPPAPPGDSSLSADCVTLVDAPLTSLTVDITPRTSDGEAVAAADLPTNCWASSGREGPAIWLEAAPICAWWDCNCLLALARFCHQPLYFEDPELERCGASRCLPQFCSIKHFLCDVAVLPARLIVRPYHTRMCTPTPHCCAPYP